MVEMDMPHAELLEEWHRWYTLHLRKLLAMPGFFSAQRFQSTTPTPSPFIAMYSIAGAEAMTSPAYRASAGPTSTGRWHELMTNWRRNVLEGIERAPEVPMTGWLAILDRHSAGAPPLPKGYVALRPIALDRSIVERGLMFGGAGSAPPAFAQGQETHLRICKPLTPLLTSV
jgi:hypothetical protein